MIEVTCAIIEWEDKVLVTQRSPVMELPWLWEFPGGKVEPGEAESDCIRREIKEELALDVEPVHQLPRVTHDYGTKVIRLIPFVCHLAKGSISLSEHQAFRWVKPYHLSALDWCPADLPVLAHYLDWRQKTRQE
jgi:8-oxo-dGTP diphosphatase